MRFTSVEFIEYLKSEFNTADCCSDNLFLELNSAIKQEVYGSILKKVPSDFVEDVYQEVCLSVWKNIYEFILTMGNKDEYQRKKWITTITNRRITDFYRSFYSKVYENEVYDELTLENESLGYYDYFSNIDKELDDEMQELLISIFSINTSAEKIIGYMFAKIIISEGKGGAKPKQTEQSLKGKKLFDLLILLRKELPLVLGATIPDKTYFPLEEKLKRIAPDGEIEGNKCFELDVKKITDGTNRIQKKIEEVYLKNGKTY